MNRTIEFTETGIHYKRGDLAYLEQFVCSGRRTYAIVLLENNRFVEVPIEFIKLIRAV